MSLVVDRVGLNELRREIHLFKLSHFRCHNGLERNMICTSPKDRVPRCDVTKHVFVKLFDLMTFLERAKSKISILLHFGGEILALYWVLWSHQNIKCQYRKPEMP